MPRGLGEPADQKRAPKRRSFHEALSRSGSGPPLIVLNTVPNHGCEIGNVFSRFRKTLQNLRAGEAVGETVHPARNFACRTVAMEHIVVHELHEPGIVERTIVLLEFAARNELVRHLYRVAATVEIIDPSRQARCVRRAVECSLIHAIGLAGILRRTDIEREHVLVAEEYSFDRIECDSVVAVLRQFQRCVVDARYGQRRSRRINAQNVKALFAIHLIVAGAVDNDVIAEAAIGYVIARATIDRVRTRKATKHVIACGAIDGIAASKHSGIMIDDGAFAIDIEDRCRNIGDDELARAVFQSHIVRYRAAEQSARIEIGLESAIVSRTVAINGVTAGSVHDPDLPGRGNVLETNPTGRAKHIGCEISLKNSHDHSSGSLNAIQNRPFCGAGSLVLLLCWLNDHCRPNLG